MKVYKGADQVGYLEHRPDTPSCVGLIPGHRTYKYQPISA